MAKTFILIDDLDGSANAETVVFSYGGTPYEIDLSRKNRAALEKLLKPYLEAAHPVTAARPRSSASRSTTSRSTASRRSAARVDMSAVRAWAADNGLAVSSRGRIPAAVLAAYQEANS